ncbi:diaminopimelate epimerase [bacterium]|nr:diaminopimelate epimerase [bacterium]
MKFWKLQATGNDFVFVNSKPRAGENSTRFVRKLCERHLGIGADGLVYFWQDAKGWTWQYCNSDGSTGEFCGNASLCMAKLLKDVFSEKKLAWQSQIGEIEVQSDSEDSYQVLFPASKVKERPIDPTLKEELYELNDRGLSHLALIDAGVPHLVLGNHDEWSIQDRITLNMDLRSHPLLGPKGANVSWYSNRNSELITFERGVDTETLGCGSAALATYLALGCKKEKSFNFPGGTLQVRHVGSNYLLKGQPELVFEGIIS